MGLFEKFIGNNEGKQQIAAEKRERTFLKERDVFAAGMQPDTENQLELENRNDFLRWQQELTPDLNELIKDLLGQYEDEEGNVKFPEDALCNLTFVREVVIPKCKPFLSKNMINSRFEEKRILMMLKRTMHVIVNLMVENHDRYGVSFVNFDGILDTIKTTCDPTPFRAWKGWTKKADITSIKEIHSFQEQREQKSKSLFGTNSGGK